MAEGLSHHMLTRWSDTSAFVVSFVSQSSFTSTFSTFAFFSFFIAVASSFNLNLNPKLHRLLLSYLKKYTFKRGSVAKWSAYRTRNPVVPGSSPALATCLIWVFGRPELKSSDMLVNSQLRLGFKSCYVDFEQRGGSLTSRYHSSSISGWLQNQRGRRRQGERQKKYLYINKQQLCSCITLFCTFLCCRCTTTTGNFLISRNRFMD